jgi:photosystem II stability/assembly factor-like uncharacterized protein
MQLSLLKHVVPLLFPCLLLAQSNYWIHTNDGPYYDIHSFAFANGEVFTCGSGGIFLSTNGGQFWSRINCDFDFHDVNCMLFANEDTVFAGTSHGIYVSSDGGVSWMAQSDGLGFRNVLALLRSPDGAVFAGTSGPAVFKSSDNGVSWQQVGAFTTGIAVSSLLLTDSGTVLAAVIGSSVIEKRESGADPIRTGGIFRSTDGGNSWDTVYAGIPQSDWLYKFVTSLSRGSNGMLYAGVTNLFSMGSGSVLTSSNDGRTWIATSFTFAARSLAADSGGGIYACTVSDSLYRTSDGGSHWVHCAASGIRSIGIDSNDRIWASVGGNGGITYSDNGGTTWQNPGRGLMNPNVTCLAFDSHGTLFAGTSQGGGIPYTTDNGTSWSRSDPITFDWINALIVNDVDEVLASGSYTFYRSTNGGYSWDTVAFPSSNSPVYSFCLDGLHTILAGTWRGILRSTTNGTSWQPVLQNDLTYYSVVRGADGSLFGGSDSGVIRSTDHGTTWVVRNNGLIDSAVRAMVSTPGGVVLAGTLTGGVYRSTDKGETWSTANSGLTGTSIQSFAVNSDGDVFVAISGGGVCRSTNDGVTWESVNSGLTFLNNTKALTVSPSGYLFAGTFNRGVFRSRETTTSVGEAYPLEPQSSELLQNFPNPFNPSTTIQYQLDRKAHVLLRVYDLLGREVMKVVDEIEAPGNKSVKLLVTHLSSGVYFYRLQADGFSQTRKFTLLR